jgi:hypothetical protein
MMILGLFWGLPKKGPKPGYYKDLEKWYYFITLLLNYKNILKLLCLLSMSMFLVKIICFGTYQKKGPKPGYYKDLKKSIIS